MVQFSGNFLGLAPSKVKMCSTNVDIEESYDTTFDMEYVFSPGEITNDY